MALGLPRIGALGALAGGLVEIRRSLPARTSAGDVYAVRGRIRAPAETNVVVTLLNDGVAVARSAPVLVGPSWSSFGLTAPARAVPGRLVLSAAPVSGAWPAGAHVEMTATAASTPPTTSAKKSGTGTAASKEWDPSLALPTIVNGTARITVSNTSSCDFRVSWTTSVPTTSRVHFGKVVIADASTNGAPRDVQSDNTIFTDEAVDLATLADTTPPYDHSVILHSATMLSNSRFRMVVGGEDADGRAQPSEPIEIRVKSPCTPRV